MPQELRYPGIVLNALMLTFGTAGSLLVAYQARLLKVTVGGGGDPTVGCFSKATPYHARLVLDWSMRGGNRTAGVRCVPWFTAGNRWGSLVAVQQYG